MEANAKLLQIRLFLRYSTRALIAVVFLYAGLKLWNDKTAWSGGRAFVMLGGMGLLWSIFRLYSVHSMSELTGQVLKGTLTYEELFSVEVSQRRLFKVMFHTVMTACIVFYTMWLVVMNSESIAGWILLLLLTAAIMVMNYIRASRVFALAKNREQIELIRAATHHTAL